MQVHAANSSATAYARKSESEPRLIRAAHEFEGQLLKELLKPMTSGSGLGNETSEEGSEGILGEFASEALGKALSECGGFGIADGIIDRLSRSGNHSGTEAVTGNLHFEISRFRSNH